jgi:RND family efflux transporter MFP subunit
MLIAATLANACGSGEHASPVEEALPTIQAATGSSQLQQIAGRVEVRGTVEAEKSAVISSRVAAMVTRVRVKAGDRVARGQVVLDIDPATAQGQLGQATGALAQAQAALALAERNYERFRRLVEKDAASNLEVDMALMQFEQAKGAVEQAEGAVGAARSVASESSVRAPFDGLVVRRMVEVGDLAAPGRPLMMIESEHGRRLSLAVPASLVARSELAIGDSIEVRLDGHESIGATSATIVERSSAADPMSHSFEIKADLPSPENGEPNVASGSTGRAWVQTEARQAVTVPVAALYRQGGLAFVVTVTENQTAEPRIVTVGDPIDELNIEILSGLGGRETVLLDLRSLPAAGSQVEATS